MKGKKIDLAEANCGIARSLQIIGDWWSLLIVREAFKGSERFNEFEKSLGLAKNILSSRLKKLVAEGIFDAVSDNGSTRTRYVLTDKGAELYVVLTALWQWGERNCFHPAELEYEMVDREKQLPLVPLQLRAHDGRLLGARDFRITVKAPVVQSLR
jgi:DNA-binding HxlR family transcriptional regulator